MTLTRAEISLKSVFEFGQAYVALSRVKSLEGLYLSSFDASKVRISKKVQDFYSQLQTEKKV
jgi:ATP-dependent DNA helicase PIF1